MFDDKYSRMSYKPLGEWKHGEREMVEEPSGILVTLTQPESFLEEDYYSIKRMVAVPHDNRADFFLYEVSALDNESGVTVLRTVYVLEDRLAVFLKEYMVKIMRGRGGEALLQLIKGGAA